MQDLAAIERQGWQALSTKGTAGQQFYSQVLHDRAVMLLPGGMVLRGKADILAALAAQPWQSFHLEDLEVMVLSPAAGIVTYRVSAQRAGNAPYAALISSTYAMSDGEFKLMLHQQTPI
ncbi:nuclear transport factor 2 family protein [Nodosilinea sp. LEGE 06152]|nr:nuclear transport factor 2 family protein [Nodosilinea sp. LEGE 06152]